MCGLWRFAERRARDVTPELRDDLDAKVEMEAVE